MADISKEIFDDTPKALAGSILLLKNDKKLREDIAEAGFRLYQDRFSAKQTARNLRKL